MSSLATQDMSTAPKTSAPEPAWSSPGWAPAQPASTSGPGLSDEQRALDAAAAADAGMGATEVSTLGTFGLRPSEMDPEAAHRMAVGLQRMEALLACNDGNATACDLTGPGLVGHQSSEGVGGDNSDDLVVEDTEFTLRLSTRTNPNGETERILSYQDVDGTFLSGRSTEPVEIIPQDADQDEAQAVAASEPQSTAEGVGSFVEGALLGDFADNDSWSAVAGQTLVGFIPVVGQIADARDTLAAVRNVAEGKDGAWIQLGAAAIGWLPGIGDALKGGSRIGGRLGKEVIDESARRVVKETVDEGEKRAVKEAVDEGGETLARHSDEVGKLAEDVAQRLTSALDPATFARLSEQLGPAGLETLARGMDAETLARVSAAIDTDTLVTLVGKGIDGHAIRELAEGMSADELKALAGCGSADEIAAAANQIANERLSASAAQLRSDHLGGRAAPAKGNAAAAELTLDDGTRLTSEATSKKTPMDMPRSHSQGPDPVTGKGGHFEPSAHADEARVRETDSEYKILTDLTDQIVEEGIKDPSGRLRLYTERAPCDSCSRIIEEFEQRFPGIELDISNDFTVDGVPL